MRSKRLWISLGILLGLLLTQRWMSWEQGKQFLLLQDVPVYEEIAKAAPNLPFVKIPFHHGQRFVPHYLLGLTAHLLRIPYPLVYWIAALGLILSIIVLFDHIVARFKASDETTALLMGLLIWNPYAFRYYLIVPGMIQDLVFVTSLCWLLASAFRQKPLQLLLALFVAALSRQTAIILLPGLAVWILWGTEWCARPLARRLLLIFASLIVVIGVFFITARIAQTFSAANVIASAVTGLLQALPNLSAGALGIFLARIIIPYMPLLGTLLGLAVLTRHKLKAAVAEMPAEFWACLLMTAAICTQPILAGPEVAGQSASRLAALGIVPALTALTLLLKKLRLTEVRWPLFWLLPLLALSSFHHMYSFTGPGNAQAFALKQVGVALLLSLAVFFDYKSTQPRTRSFS